MTCKKCEAPLTGKQTSYCSFKCSKLHLKQLYRQRKKEHIKEYNKKYREQNSDYVKKYRKSYSKNNYRVKKRIYHLEENPVCEKCGTDKNLEVHHIKPLKYGGQHKSNNLMTLCKSHHMQFEILCQQFFKSE
jgi:5-methylcytosine-specific restriction enzyme A